MTLLQLVNRVLRRLREDEVTDLSTDTYSKLVAEFVADAHREVVEAHDWAVMDKDLIFLTTAGTDRYSLGAGSPVLYTGYETGVSPKAQLRYRADMPLAAIYEDLTTLIAGTVLTSLEQGSYAEVQDARLSRNGTTGRPSLFALEPTATGLDLIFDAPADATYYVYLRFHDPEAEINVDTDAARELIAPSAPVLAGAVYYALNERGEEMGEPGNVAERRYVTALGTAIETDTIRATRANTHEMYRD